MLIRGKNWLNHFWSLNKTTADAVRFMDYTIFETLDLAKLEKIWTNSDMLI